MQRRRLHRRGEGRRKQRRERLNFTPFTRVRRDTGFHLVDEIGREARTLAGVSSLTAQSYQVRSTIRPDLQRATEASLQEGLARYEQSAGRAEFRAPEANLADAIRKHRGNPKGADFGKPSWRRRARSRLRLPLYDVHWTPAVVLIERKGPKGGELMRVGLSDGRTFPLSTGGTRMRARLNPYDVIYIQGHRAHARQGATSTRVELRARPSVQGTAVVLQNKTGRILAMAGGFSYPLSQLNRVTQARRQPGSSFKPMTYLAALNSGLQPNTLVDDAPITYPPIGGANAYTRDTDYWSPHNYDGGSSGTITIRRALEMSKNLVTARLLDGGIAGEPSQSLDQVCKLAIEARIYSKCERYYPFVLGAQPLRPVDLAGFYAAIANEGKRPTPHVIESITRDGNEVYKADEGLHQLATVDPAAIFQLRTFLQGVVARGTAARMSSLSNFIGGKTGTSDDFNDAWFAGFSNDVTVVVWVGYDNARGKRTLGSGQAGGKVAIPIFEPIMKAAWADIAPQTPLPQPSPEAARHLVAAADRPALRPAARRPARLQRGRRLLPLRGPSRSRPARVSGGFMEYFRTRRQRPSQRHPGTAGVAEQLLRQRIWRGRLQPVLLQQSVPVALRQLQSGPGYGFPRGGPGYNQEPRYVPPQGPMLDPGTAAPTDRASERSSVHSIQRGEEMSRLRLSVATTDYDHFRDFRLGTVQAEGIDTTWSMLGHHEIFARFTFNREWDAAELSFAKFMAQVTRKDSDIIGLPVVCSRLFRFSSFYVNKKSKIRTAKDLKGKTIGSPEWAHTAAVYMRGWLNDEHGIGAEGHPLGAGRRQRGRPHREGRAEPAQGRQAHPHQGQVAERDGGVGRDRLRADRASAGLLPPGPQGCGAAVPGLLGDGGEILQGHQGLADHAHHRGAEARARRQSMGGAQPLQRLRRLQEPQRRAADGPGGVALSGGLAADLYAQACASCSAPIPSLRHRGEPADLGALLRYAHEQGIAHRHVKPEEIFPKGIMTSVRV